MRQWDPERVIDEDRARELIATQFPELADVHIRQLAAGWDNTVHLVDGRWAFRFPRRQIAVPGVEREIASLGRLAPHLPLSIPEPRFIGAPSGGYDWPWFGAPFLPGRELAEAALADEHRKAVGAGVGAFLRALHDGALMARVGPSLPIDPLRRADMPYRVAGTRERLDGLVKERLWASNTAVTRLLKDAETLPPPSRTVVLHGDLHVRHVLVDAEGGPTGVIDWGDVCAGDPSVDLAFAFGSLSGTARQVFREAYGPIDGLTELRARVIAVFLAAALLAYADAARLAPLRAEALTSLDRAVD
jgi:aminoglycoside phosphotransferase (APT) family kinase protein